MNSLSELYKFEGYDFLDVYTHTPEEAKELMEIIKNLPEVKGKTFTFHLNSEDFDLVSTQLSFWKYGRYNGIRAYIDSVYLSSFYYLCYGQEDVKKKLVFYLR